MDGKIAQPFSQTQDENTTFRDAGRLTTQSPADLESYGQDVWSIDFWKCDSFSSVSQGRRSFDDIAPTPCIQGELPNTQGHGFNFGILDSEMLGEDHTRTTIGGASAACEYLTAEQFKPISGGIDSQNRYYEYVVSVNVSHSLLPLPEILLSHPANKLHFRHFIDNTARLLVGHDCGRNPFRTILPYSEFVALWISRHHWSANSSLVAISDDSLMNVLLAYSATHRADVLRHQSPSKQIELYLQNAGYTISGSLHGLACKDDLTKLGAHLLLVSMHLTCASPKGSYFIQQMSWRGHLRAARDLIDLRRNQPWNYAFDFLTRWFIGLESMKSPCDFGPEQPLILELQDQNAWRSLPSSCHTVCPTRYHAHIDCLWGVSTRCLIGLTKVAQMKARATLNSNKDVTSTVGNTLEREALELRAELISDVEGKTLYIGNCTPSPKNEQTCHELSITDQAYQLAALVHLNRQILRLPSSHPHVRNLVSTIFHLLQRFRQLKNTMLFPIVTAGLEAQTAQDESIVLDCFKKLENNGFPTVGSLIPFPLIQFDHP